jgi:hypothetical protein
VTPDGLYTFSVNFNLHGDMVPSTTSRRRAARHALSRSPRRSAVAASGPSLVAGPTFKNVDLAVVKLVPIAGRLRAEFNGEIQARVVQITVRVSW